MVIARRRCGVFWRRRSPGRHVFGTGYRPGRSKIAGGGRPGGSRPRSAPITGPSGLAGGLYDGSFLRFADDVGKGVDDGDEMRVVP